MSILLTISVLTLVALIWAIVSIVQHIRASRRRHKALRARQAQPATGTLGLVPIPRRNDFAEYSFAALAPSSPVSRPVAIQQQLSPVPSPVSRLISMLDEVQATSELPQPIALVPKSVAPPPRVEVITERIPERPVELAVEPAPALIENPITATDRRPPTRSMPAAEAPVAEPIALNATAPTVEISEEEAPELRRPVRSVNPHASSPFIPLRRPDWVYFNKDMGDLSDPQPSRVRERRVANSR